MENHRSVLRSIIKVGISARKRSFVVIYALGGVLAVVCHLVWVVAAVMFL